MQSQQEREDKLSIYLKNNDIAHVSSTFGDIRIYTFIPIEWNSSITVIIPPTRCSAPGMTQKGSPSQESSYELTKDSIIKVIQGKYLSIPFNTFDDLLRFIQTFR